MNHYTKIALIGIFLIGVAYMATPRGIRNNNPMNLREGDDGGDQWNGEHRLDLDKEFEEFTSAKYGIRAGAKILLNYQRIHGLDTLQEIISRWAPPSENETDSYIEHAARVLEISPAEQINLTNASTLAKLVNVIIKHENGINPYSNATVIGGVRMALA